MTLTQLLAYGQEGANTSLADGSSEFTTIYTVPAGNTMLLKEVRVSIGATTGMAVGLYIMKTGGANPLHSAALTVGGINSNEFETVNVIKAEATTSETSYTVTAHNTVMAAGDSLRMRSKNTSGAAINSTKYGAYGMVSGDLV